MGVELVGTLPAAGENNLWYDYTDARLVLVFVHGVLSDSRNCWLRLDDKREPSVYWPALIKTDKRLPRMAIYLGGYYTAIDAGPYCRRQRHQGHR
jgi:hypothetical protein